MAEMFSQLVQITAIENVMIWWGAVRVDLLEFCIDNIPNI